MIAIDSSSWIAFFSDAEPSGDDCPDEPLPELPFEALPTQSPLSSTA